MNLTQRALDAILADYRQRPSGIQLALNGDVVPPAPPDWLPLRQQLEEPGLAAAERRLLRKMWNDRRFVGAAWCVAAGTLLALLGALR
jgi:hypothetical protein